MFSVNAKPARDPRRVDQAVDRAVEVLARGPEQDEQAEALAALLDERRLHDAAQEVGRCGVEPARRLLDELHSRADDERDRHRDARAPQEREDHRDARLGLPAVHPANAEEHDRERHERHDAAERDGIAAEDVEQEHRDTERDDRGDDDADDPEREQARAAARCRTLHRRRRLGRRRDHGRGRLRGRCRGLSGRCGEVGRGRGGIARGHGLHTIPAAHAGSAARA
jgi:hypothetical protein